MTGAGRGVPLVLAMKGEAVVVTGHAAAAQKAEEGQIGGPPSADLSAEVVARAARHGDHVSGRRCLSAGISDSSVCRGQRP